MVFRWSVLKIVYDSSVLHFSWPPLHEIEISSIEMSVICTMVPVDEH